VTELAPTGAAEATKGARTAEPVKPPPPASPLVRRLARESGLDLADLTGSGPGGRIIRLDVERALAARDKTGRVAESRPGTAQPPDPGHRPSSPEAADASDPRRPVRKPVSQLRRVIARRLSETAADVPQFTVTLPVDVGALEEMRQNVNQHLEQTGRGRVSINDLVMRAAALALTEFGQINSSWAGDHILEHERVNIAVAVATERGLVAPVIMDAATKTPARIGQESRTLAEAAVNGSLSPEQMSGATFTVSNLGMYGVEEFTAIINPPQAAILAVGAARDELALVDAAPAARRIMRLTLSADHRVIDGALAAQFLNEIRRLLESPYALLT
jgi:pyruvate dehydrogenase E2 component (dihydrolipoamide acetyltransferase)